jgi:hypothetical protein
MRAEITPGPGWWKATDGEWYPPRWEYRWARGYLCAKKHLDNIEDVIVELGLQGWEAVGAIGESSGVSASSVSVLMKRPVIG